MNYAAAEQAKANRAALEAMFDRICDGEQEASIEAQEKLIARIDELRDEIRTNSARTIRTWGDELASLNID